MSTKLFIASLLLIFTILFHPFMCPLSAGLDLEAKAQSFVLETKKIEIPGYPEAFNPSIVRWKGNLLMCFRVLTNPLDLWVSKIGLIWLDENYNPLGIPQLLDTRVSSPLIPSRSEDARLFTVGDRLFITYNDNEEIRHGATRRIYYAELDYDGALFHEKNREPLLMYEGENKKIWEKNWVPFDYKSTMLFIYSLTPHLILCPVVGSKKCETFASTEGIFDWPWGTMRGGTPALLIENEYLSFFHSCKIVKTKQSNDKALHHYFMGAYTFSSDPPFNVTRISPEPIIGKDFYSDSLIYKKIHKHVVFPGGYVMDKHHIWLVYGREDCQVWVVKLEKEGLFRSLIPVRTFYEYVP
jgi:predicted GH43/DUF377 family glycosyl hydrolase